MISLYHIGIEYQNLLNQLYDYETGEVNQEVEAKINELTDVADTKCIAVASYIKNMELEKLAIQHAKKQIEKREQDYEKEIQRRIDYLKTNMRRSGITEVKCPYFTIKLIENPYSTTIFDANSIPVEYKKTEEVIKTIDKIDLKKIKSDILNGVNVPGAKIEKKLKLQIITDKK